MTLMPPTASFRLKDLSVSKKLALGFGFLLSMVVLVSALGYFTANTFISRLNKAAYSDNLKSILLELHASEQEYVHTLSGEAADKQRNQLTAFDSEAVKGLKILTSPFNIAMLKDIQQETQRYRTIFEALVKANDDTLLAQ